MSPRPRSRYVIDAAMQPSAVHRRLSSAASCRRPILDERLGWFLRCTVASGHAHGDLLVINRDFCATPFSSRKAESRRSSSCPCQYTQCRLASALDYMHRDSLGVWQHAFGSVSSWISPPCLPRLAGQRTGDMALLGQPQVALPRSIGPVCANLGPWHDRSALIAPGAWQNSGLPEMVLERYDGGTGLAFLYGGGFTGISCKMVIGDRWSGRSRPRLESDRPEWRLPVSLWHWEMSTHHPVLPFELPSLWVSRPFRLISDADSLATTFRVSHSTLT